MNISETSIKKRSVNIAGHQTSVSIEAPFWDALKELAARELRVAQQVVRVLQPDLVAQRQQRRIRDVDPPREGREHRRPEQEQQNRLEHVHGDRLSG